MNRRQFIDRSVLALAGLSVASCTEGKKSIFGKDQVFACFGDSITASKDGYVKILQTTMDSKEPNPNLRFLNLGKSSETITGLTEKEHPGPRPYLFDRLDAELDKAKIDVALFCYGINCGIYGPPSEELFANYKKGVDTFLKKMKKEAIQVVLLTPPPLALDVVSKVQTNAIDDYGYLNPYPEYDKEVLQEFKSIILSTNHKSIIKKIDIHTPLYSNRSNCYSGDPIHPNLTGHKLIADAIVEKLGF